ncbi:MAG: SUF system Fe-S cluster assembly regulator [Pseudomonadota bacterium]
MLKLGKLTDYATVLLAAMAAAPERLYAAQELSSRTSVAAPTVAKLMKQLQQGGLVSSTRGSRGGYRLLKAPAQVTVADVIRALEGPIALTDCAVHGACAIEAGCGAKAPFRLINAAITQALEAVTLADMAASMAPTGRVAVEVKEFPLQFHPANSPLTGQVNAHVRRR